MRRLETVFLCGLALLISNPVAAARQEAATCRPAAGTDAAAALVRAEQAMGVPDDGRALFFRSMGRQSMNFQSDRSYAPFFNAPDEAEQWYDPASRAELRRTRGVYPRTGPGEFGVPLITVEKASWAGGETLRPLGPAHPGMAPVRRLNPWAVVADWRDDAQVRVAGLCTARDYPRLTLTRTAYDGVEETLYLDPKTGFPVQLVRIEPNVLWGQLETTYLWSTWIEVGTSSFFPSSSFRMTEIDIERERTVGEIRLVARDSMPLPDLPPVEPMLADPGFLVSTPPDTVRVHASTVLLTQRFYNEAVVFARDTVFVLDATMAEERARQDSTLIAGLFPGNYPVVVVVTDLAWPHISGVRFWVARGATIVSHEISRPFLQRVVERRWHVQPDALERNRAASPFRFVGVRDSLSLGGGAVHLHAIDGIGSEGALMAWVPEANFLWAGDFIQNVQGPSLYAAEVARAVARVGFVPARFAAQHEPLNEWQRVLEANAPILNARR